MKDFKVKMHNNLREIVLKNWICSDVPERVKKGCGGQREGIFNWPI